MAKNLLHRSLRFSTIVTTLVVAVVLTGCANGEDPAPEESGEPEEVVSIGVTLSSPGLAAGSDPAETSGAEITLAQSIVAELETPDPDAQTQWVPIGATDDPVSAIEDAELEFMLGQLSEPRMSDELAWVGPYATITPALLVRQGSENSDETADELEPLATITSLDELAEAAVCVVENSSVADIELPADKVTVQRSVTECEVGMRSGRYDAIAADDLQLAGVLTEPNRASTYTVLSWDELADDAQETEVPEALLDSHHYWIATDPARCDAVAEALHTVLDQGMLTETFSEWEELTGLEPDVATPSDVTTKNCSS